MCVTATLTQTQRKRLDRSVLRAEKRGRRASATRVHGLDRPNPGVSASPDTTRGKKACSAGRFKQPFRQAAGYLGNVGKGEPAGRRSGVDGGAFAGQHLQADAPPSDIFGEMDEMAKVAAETVELPDDEDVAFTERLDPS